MKTCGQPNCFEPDACIWPKCNTKQKDKTMKPTTITAYPVMLPTNEETKLFIRVDKPNVLLYNVSVGQNKTSLTHQGYHLYLTSKEEIKDGDWVYSKLYGLGQVESDYGGNATKHVRPLTVKFLTSEVRQQYGRDGIWQIGVDGSDVASNNCKKVIATTDRDLIIKTDLYGIKGFSKKAEQHSLPQPPQSFIKQWVESNGTIESVEVEMDYNVKSGTLEEIKEGLAGYEYYTLKTTQDNCVIIHKEEKKMYSREEVIAFAKKYVERCQAPIQVGEKWIEENL